MIKSKFPDQPIFQAENQEKSDIDNHRNKAFIDFDKMSGRKNFFPSKEPLLDDISLNPSTIKSRIHTAKIKRYHNPHAIDFGKTISRERLNTVFGDKKGIIAFSVPNYNYTRPSTIFFK